MHLPYRAGPDRLERRSNRGRDFEFLLSASCNVPPFVWLTYGEDAKRERKRLGRSAGAASHAFRTEDRSPGTLP